MKFRLHPDVDQYFHRMKNKPDEWKKWHTYYLCLMVGFDETMLSNRKLTTKDEFLEKFIEEFRTEQPKIIACLIYAELKRQGNIQNNSDIDTRAMKDTMLTLLDHRNENRLKDEAIDLMNKYADHGFLTIENKINNTDDFPTFLVSYYSEFMEPFNK